MRRRDVLLSLPLVPIGVAADPTPPAADPSRLLAVLESFAAAWNRHDADALMSHMADECVFDASAGPAVNGTRHAGRDAVRAAYSAIWEAIPDAKWNDATHFVSGDRGVSEWRFTGTQKDGGQIEVLGCDLFTFRGDKILVKNSYRKNRPAQPAR